MNTYVQTPSRTEIKDIVDKAIHGMGEIDQVSKRVEDDSFVVYHVNISGIVSIGLSELVKIERAFIGKVENVSIKVFPQKKNNIFIVILGDIVKEVLE